MDTLDIEHEYILSLNHKEHKSYLIAKKHLGNSFEICRSIGFLEWKKNQNSTNLLGSNSVVPNSE